MRLLAVIAGASRWPNCSSLEANPSLSRSAELAAEFFLSPDGLHLRRAELFFVFDDDRSADILDERLGAWLDERLAPSQQEQALGGPVTDILFYYIGHGYRSGDSLFLTVQSSREGNIEQSSWSSSAVAHTLRKYAPRLRKHIILDCCYGAAAVSSFQKPDDAGVAVFYAAEKFSPAIAPPAEQLTLFTEAFIITLTSGVAGAPELLSLDDVCKAMRPRLQPRQMEPNVVDAIIRTEPVSRQGLFQNRVGIEPTSGDVMKREFYSRLIEIERRFEDRLKRRIEQLESDYSSRIADSASRVTLLTRELKERVRELNDQQSRAATRAAQDGSAIERRGWKRAFLMLGIGLSVVTVVLASGLFREVARAPDDVVVVNPALGWQGGIHVKRDEQVCITADGRVNLGLNQVVNLMNAAKGIIARFAAPDSEAKLAVTADDEVGDLTKLTFRRPWNDPEGVDGEDTLLSPAKLKIECKWGTLLAVVVADQDSARSSADPFEVLKNSNYSPADVRCIGRRLTYSSPREGQLVFMVNDAVNSGEFPEVRLRSKEILDAMKAAAPVLANESHGRRLLDEASLPLFWYADNGGQFIVQIHHGACRN